MFIDNFVKEDVKYIDDDYKILDIDNIEKYDKKNIEEKFKKLLMCIKEEECKYLCLNCSNMSRNNDVRYEQHTIHKSDPTAKVAIERIETEEDLVFIYEVLKKIFDLSLCYSEKVVFVDYILLKRTRDYVEKRLHVGNDKFYQIKNSCLIKFALALNWKNIKVNDIEEGLL